MLLESLLFLKVFIIAAVGELIVALLLFPLVILYYRYLVDYEIKYCLSKNFNLFKGFFKFYYAVLRFKKPKF